MHRRGILTTLALGLICAIASAPVPALSLAPTSTPTLHSAAALKSLWTVRYDTGSPAAMEAHLIERFGPLPWHFERGNGEKPGEVGVIVTGLEHRLIPTGSFGNPFYGLTALGHVVGLPPDHRLSRRNGGLNDIRTVAFERRFRPGTIAEITKVVRLPA